MKGRAIVLMVAVTCLGCGERGEHRDALHEDRRAAERAGAIVPGRIPQWIPRSARHLREARDLVPFRVSWWPSDLPPSGGVTLHYVLYACESGLTFLAIRVGASKAYYWRP